MLFDAASDKAYLARALRNLSHIEHASLLRFAVDALAEAGKDPDVDILNWVSKRERSYGMRVDRLAKLGDFSDVEILGLLALFFNAVGNEQAAQVFADQAAYAQGRLDQAQESGERTAAVVRVQVAQAAAAERRLVSEKGVAAKREKVCRRLDPAWKLAIRLASGGTSPSAIIGIVHRQTRIPTRTLNEHLGLFVAAQKKNLAKT